MTRVNMSDDLSPLERGKLLYEVHRYREALAQFVEHLKEYADDARAMAWAALCWVKLGDKQRAQLVAEQAISMDPDQVFAHLAYVQVLRARNKLAEAREAIREALKLDPGRPDILGTAAALACDQKKWAEALELCQQGLEQNPRDENCQHARAWALVNLGRVEEAKDCIHSMLADHPEDADCYGYLGYAALRQGKREEALEAFSTALKIDPENESSREGFLNALRMSYPLYGLVVRYLMWVSSLSSRVRWAMMLAEHFLEKLLQELANRHPALRPLIRWILWAWSVFSYLSFAARPIGNTLLRFNHYGRKFLREDEVMESNLVASSLLIGLAAWARWHLMGGTWSLVACIIYFTLVIPLTNIYTCLPGWPRKLMGAFAATLAVIGNMAIWAIYDSPLTGGGARELLQFYVILLLANQITASQLEKNRRD